MREIKFRCWNNSEEREIAGWMDFDSYNGDVFDETGRYSFLSIIEGGFSDITVQQFTGIIDKNNQEVYEGDIVNLRGKVGEIVWDGDYYCYALKVDGESEPLYIDDDLNMEVVGNVFENPELLRQKPESI